MTSKNKVLISVLAVVAGIAINFLALPIDQFFHTINVFPPWGEPMRDVSDNLLALFYRSLLAVGAGYLTALLAPSRPMRHALVLGAIGLVISALGAYVAISQMDTGPAWYPIALTMICVPTSVFGARLYSSSRKR